VPMLRQLAVHNIVLVERLELEFEPGLGVLTGETGAGKSILLDALGLALGAGMGALSAKLSDYGIDDKFAKQVATDLQPNTSAIFMLVRRSTPDKVVPEIAKFGGTILQTSLPAETEQKLQEALKQGGGEQIAQAQATAEAQTVAATQTPTDTSASQSAQ